MRSNARTDSHPSHPIFLLTAYACLRRRFVTGSAGTQSYAPAESQSESSRSAKFAIRATRLVVSTVGLASVPPQLTNALIRPLIWKAVRHIGQLQYCTPILIALLTGGGCAVPLISGSPSGIDCTAIPGVVDVSCHSGSCVVHRCQPGYTVSMDQTFCIKKSQKHFQGGDVAAGVYGLEHVPMK